MMESNVHVVLDSPDVSRGVRSLCLSPDGLELALGDRAGNLK